MKYLDSAFRQLEFSIKLMHAAEAGTLRVEEIDTPLTIADGPSVLVLHDRVLASQNDLILTCQNNVSVAFGAAAITLNRCREECDIPLPDPINSEVEQWVAIVYQIRNAFAHDISEPKWNINPRFAREYVIGRITVDLRGMHGVGFEHAHIGGPEGLFALRDYGLNRVLV